MSYDNNIVLSWTIISSFADVLRKARLADFGISRTLPKGQTSRQTKRAGTKCWMATENIAKDDNVACKMSADIQVSIFSVKILVYSEYFAFLSCSLFSCRLPGCWHITSYLEDIILLAKTLNVSSTFTTASTVLNMFEM